MKNFKIKKPKSTTKEFFLYKTKLTFETGKQDLNVKIDKSDMEQFMEEIRLINYFASSKDGVSIVENLYTFKKYISPTIKKYENEYNLKFIDLYNNTELTFVNKHSQSCEVVANFNKETIRTILYKFKLLGVTDEAVLLRIKSTINLL